MATFCTASSTVCDMLFLHEDGVLIDKCDGFTHEFILVFFNLSAIRFEMHSSSIVLCNFPQIKIM